MSPTAPNLVLTPDPIRGLPHMIARVAGADTYPFRSGGPVDTDKLSRAISFAHAAAHQMTVARVYEGRSDYRRDEALTEASAALDEARRLLTEARTPEPPRVAPAAMPSLFSVACEIVKPMNTEAA